MPTKLLIISDMEFNEADCYKTNLDVIRAKYSDAGYKMPEIVFWNVNGRLGNVPASAKDAVAKGGAPPVVLLKPAVELALCQR